MTKVLSVEVTIALPSPFEQGDKEAEGVLPYYR